MKMIKPGDQRDRLFQEIKEIDDPILCASIRLFENDHATLEEAMMVAVQILVDQKTQLKVERINKRIIDAVGVLLIRIQDEKGTGFWERKPSTDLEEAAQALAKLVPPE